MYLSCREASRRFGIDPKWCRELIDQGRVRGYVRWGWQGTPRYAVQADSLQEFLRQHWAGIYAGTSCRIDPESGHLSGWVPTQRAAVLARCSPGLIRRALARGDIRGVRTAQGMWMVELESLRAWVARRRQIPVDDPLYAYQLRLVRELLTGITSAYRRHITDGWPLPPNCISIAIDAIHRRERPILEYRRRSSARALRVRGESVDHGACH